MKKLVITLLIVGFASVAAQAADIIKGTKGTQLPTARGFEVEGELRNDQAQFTVRVEVDRKDRTYAKGELMRVAVKSERSGYLYLLYRQADGTTKCLFPNLYESNNAIRGGRTIILPTEKQGFRLRCSAPYGNELLAAIVTRSVE